eukprot:Gb_30723 [translate_table: standard]
MVAEGFGLAGRWTSHGTRQRQLNRNTFIKSVVVGYASGKNEREWRCQGAAGERHGVLWGYSLKLHYCCETRSSSTQLFLCYILLSLLPQPTNTIEDYTATDRKERREPGIATSSNRPATVASRIIQNDKRWELMDRIVLASKGIVEILVYEMQVSREVQFLSVNNGKNCVIVSISGDWVLEKLGGLSEVQQPANDEVWKFVVVGERCIDEFVVVGRWCKDRLGKVEERYVMLCWEDQHYIPERQRHELVPSKRGSHDDRGNKADGYQWFNNSE